MLIEADVKIEVKNDGKQNEVSLAFDKSITLQELVAIVEMANESLKKAFSDYLSKRKDLSPREIQEIYSKISMEEIYSKIGLDKEGD